MKLQLLKEETIKPISLDQLNNKSDNEDNETYDDIDTNNDIPEIALKNACQDMINDLIQTSWELISSINSTIATIEFDYKQKENKNEIIELLNSIVDDSTINIGILHKVFELLNSEKANLLASGEEKAEQIISSDSE